jgi:hypothetical protein
MEDKVVPDWRKSSYSGNGGGNCVEVGTAAHTIAVRDTKQDGAGPVLRFSPAAWRRFAGHLRRSLAPDPARYRRALFWPVHEPVVSFRVWFGF